MKRSTQVSAPLLAATALSLLTGCRQMQRCVNENNVVVDDSFCKDQPNQPQQRSDGHGGFIPFFPYRYYYGGYGGYGIGTPASGGSYIPSAGRSYVTRGGFGSSFAEGGSHSSGSSSGGHSSSGGANNPPRRTMQRIPLTPRENWQQTVESKGLTFHTLENGTPYWDESAAYQFTAAEIDTLEAAGNTLQEMCLAAAQHIIDEKRYAELDIPEAAIESIEWAWNNEPPALYGRFDISWAGAQSGHPPKLLEYNADTPTSLLEAAVVQWHWLKDMPASLVSHKPDQFNSIHEKLIAKWQDIDPYLSKPVYFAALNNPDNPEDQLTVTYLRDTAQQAGLDTRQLAMADIGWDAQHQTFVDLDDHAIFSIFKLYPWEAMLQEEFGAHAIDTYTVVRWIEPIWKMLLSNKGILPILWQLYPNHDLLLEAHFANEDGTIPTTLKNYVRKPLISREGANITLVRDNATVATTEGPYQGPQILQALAPEAIFDHRHTVLGLWMIDQDCCGMGVRESFSPITGNLSSFVPHFFT